MPLYDYDCAACGRRFEVIHGVHADSPTTCPLCGKGPVRKAITAPAVHYKGSGWAKKERRAGARSGASTGADGSSSGADGSSSKDGSSTSDAGGSSEVGSSDGSSSDGPKAKPKAAEASATKTTD
jgi:putative FmdB family regulatory protein